MKEQSWNILLVEDDEDDFILARDYLASVHPHAFKLSWAPGASEALRMLQSNSWDAVLVDYALGAQNGLSLLQEAQRAGCSAPIILLTGQGNYQVDMEAMRLGAADYLAKSEMTPGLLERTIRYAIERKRAEEALRRAQDALEERVEERTRELKEASKQLAYQAYLLESVNDAIIATDENFILTGWNQAAERIYGWTSEEALGKRVDQLLFPKSEMPMAAEVLRRIKEQGSFEGEVTQIRKDGQPIHMELKLNVLRDEDGRISGYAGVNRDITRRKQVEAELAEVHHLLVKNNESERIQLAQELHDNPIQVLYGLIFQLHTLVDDSMSEELKQKVRASEATAQEVINMLRGVCGELRPPTLAPFGLEKTIRSHAERFQQEHPELRLKLELDADGLALLEGTRLALFRIYQNALSNVVRHAKATQVKVRFRLLSKNAVLEIQDNGCGFTVPSGWINFVRQGHLGLAGAAERAEAMGGTFEVKSEVNKGTTIRVSVPKQK